MKKLVSIGLIIGCSLALLGFGNAALAAPKETTIRVATFNIDAKAIPDIAAQRKLLADNKVEIAGLQEVDQNTQRNKRDMAKLFKKSPYKAIYFVKAMDFDGGKYGICLVSKYPFLAQSMNLLDSAGAEEQRVYQRVVIEKDNKQIAVYNTHLSWDTEKIRHKQLNELKAAVDQDKVAYKIILGDLNVDQHHKELNIFKTDYNLGNGKDGAWYDTFNGDDPAMKVMSVDNIITTKNIEISWVKMLVTKLADHNLFMAELKLLAK